MPKNYGIIGKKQETTVLTAGGIIGLNNSYHDILNNKYPDRGSSELWVALNAGGVNQHRTPNSSVVDDSGNIYLFGSYDPDQTNDLGGSDDTSQIPWVQKWNSDGMVLWDKFYYHYNSSNANYPTNGSIQSVAIDPNGSYIYAVCHGYPYFTSNTNMDIFVLKISTTDGSLDWFKIYSSAYNSNSNEYEQTAPKNGICCVNDNGSTRIYYMMHGNPNSSGNNDCWITELNDSGVIQTTKWFEATTSYSGSITAKGSNIYVGIYSYAGGAGYFDWSIIKLDTSLSEVWKRSLGKNYSDYGPRCIRVDSNDNVYAVGQVNDAYSSSTQNDALIVKYNSSGTLQWSKVIYGTRNDTESIAESDQSYSVDVDSDGYAYMQVQTPYILSILKFDSDGTLDNEIIIDGEYENINEYCYESSTYINGNYIYLLMGTYTNQGIERGIFKLKKDMSLPPISVRTALDPPMIWSFTRNSDTRSGNANRSITVTNPTSLTTNSNGPSVANPQSGYSQSTYTCNSNDMIVATPYSDPELLTGPYKKAIRA